MFRLGFKELAVGLLVSPVVKGYAFGTSAPSLAVGGTGTVFTRVQDYLNQMCSSHLKKSFWTKDEYMIWQGTEKCHSISFRVGV